MPVPDSTTRRKLRRLHQLLAFTIVLDFADLIIGIIRIKAP